MNIDNGRFILDEKGNPVPEPDLIKWAEWFEKQPKGRVIERTLVKDHEVSTVFLALDYSFAPGQKPVLFETMIFEKNLSEHKFGKEKIKYHQSLDYQERYHTKIEAMKGHKKAIAWLKKEKYGSK